MTAPDPADSDGALVRSSAVVAVGTLLSRLTGLARVGALTFAVGGGALADAYNLANTTPNIVYELLLGGVLSATLVPVFVGAFDERDEDAVSAVLTVATVVLVVLTVLAVVASPLIFRVYQAPELREAGEPLLRFFLPQMLFYGWTALGTAVLHARRSFTVPAFAPVLNNIVVSGALIAFGLRMSDTSQGAVTSDRTALWLLGLGTTAGIVAMTVPLWPAMRKAGVVWRWRFQPRHRAVVTVLRRGGWTLGYVAANQVGLTIILALAASTERGVVSAYTYAFIFFQLPHGLVAVSLMTTFVPALASAWGDGDRARYRERFGAGLRLLLVGIVPAAAGYALVAHPLVRVLLERGAFDAEAAEGAGSVLLAMTLGLPGFSAYLFVLRGFYAQGDTRTPFFLNVGENVMQVGLSALLLATLDSPEQALGFAYAGAYTLAAIAALVTLHRRVGGVADRPLLATTVRLGLAAAAMVGAVTLARAVLPDTAPDAADLGVAVVVGAAAFVAAALLLRVRELSQLVGAVARRSGRA